MPASCRVRSPNGEVDDRGARGRDALGCALDYAAAWRNCWSGQLVDVQRSKGGGPGHTVDCEAGSPLKAANSGRCPSFVTTVGRNRKETARSQHELKLSNVPAGRAPLQKARPELVLCVRPERRPCPGAGDSVDVQPLSALESAHSLVRLWSEASVERALIEASGVKRNLKCGYAGLRIRESGTRHEERNEGEQPQERGCAHRRRFPRRAADSCDGRGKAQILRTESNCAAHNGYLTRHSVKGGPLGARQRCRENGET
jgi:hypothetical protein